MKLGSNHTEKLKDNCPKCNKKLYTYSHCPATDNLELTFWHVECTFCPFEDEETFISLEDVGTKFELIKH